MMAPNYFVFQSPDRKGGVAPSPLPTGRGSDDRAGFTLIELLVVIALIMVLAGIAVLFVPRIEEGQRAARGASFLQGWLNVAKQRALRDQQGRGLRPHVSSGIVTQCPYLYSPGDCASRHLCPPPARRTL